MTSPFGPRRAGESSTCPSSNGSSAATSTTTRGLVGTHTRRRHCARSVCALLRSTQTRLGPPRRAHLLLADQIVRELPDRPASGRDPRRHHRPLRPRYRFALTFAPASPSPSSGCRSSSSRFSRCRCSWPLLAAPRNRSSSKFFELHSTGQLRTIDGIELRVHNRPIAPADASLHRRERRLPHELLVSARQNSGQPLEILFRPLQQSHGPSYARRTVSRCHRSTAVSLSKHSRLTPPPSAPVQPCPRPHWAAPLLLAPERDEPPVRTSRPIRFTVQLVNRLGNPIRHGGTRSRSGRSSTGSAPAPGRSIDRPAPRRGVAGHSRTDAQGRVTFTVHGGQAQAEPVFFQAWIAPARGAPKGFSNLLAIQFVAR